MRENDPVASFDDVKVKRATDKAILVEIDGEEHWIPKSHVHDDSEVWDDAPDARGPGRLVVSQWIAEQKGIA